MTELILTSKERIRMHEDQRITAEFNAMRKAYPDATPHRIMKSIAASGNFRAKTSNGVRDALVRTGAYVPQKRS